MTVAAESSREEPPPEDAVPEVVRGTGAYAVAWRQFKKDRVAVVALISLIALGAVSLTSPLLANNKPVVCKYQGELHWPAFQDYIDENFPIPFGVDWLRTTDLFSPKYPEIEKQAGWSVPNWVEIRREIDRGEAEGWYVSAPVPYYYKQNSSAIKLLPGEFLAHLELPSVAGDAFDDEDDILEFVPGREAGREMGIIRRRLPEGRSTRAKLSFDEDREVWLVLDASELSWKRPDREWTSFRPKVGEATLFDVGYRSRDFSRAAYAAWEWRDAYGLSRVAEDLDDPVARDDATALRLARRWRYRNAESRFHADRVGGPLEAEDVAWTEVAGFPAVRLEAEVDRREGVVKTVVRLVVTVDRVLILATSAPEARFEAVDAAVLESVAVEVPSDDTMVEGEQVVGRERLSPGDEVSLSGLTATYYPQTPFYMGTDDSGRCVLSRLVHGTVIAGSVGIISVGIYVFIGIIVGALAGYFRGWTDLVISRVIEVVICFPTLFLIILVAGFWQKKSIYLIMVTLGLIRWTGVARLVRGEFLKVMSEDYVNAARALGLSDTRIIFRHILPNSIAPVFVSASFGVAGAILVESSLSFLGFGVAPPTASWGEILGQGQRYVNENLYHLVWAPGICIFFTVTMFNLVGEGLRDALDPKLRT